ncbi:hypothetical protein [Nocardioides soli]|uniref:Uncharacterized protein n=1 Tax=Nocardioides soli TaxID=1036020 RepID=A0A7W4YZW1_9ACTN|nr:hypothetical protein [Nocardioides soli]MBB3041178.1 hypothetical protein [Nocardioides soli]
MTTTETCAHGCNHVEPYGWAVTVGCPAHDPDARVRALVAQIDPADVLPVLMRLAADPAIDEYHSCVVCGSHAVIERGVSIVSSVKPEGQLVGVAWCASERCQTDRRSTRALVEKVGRVTAGGDA